MIINNKEFQFPNEFIKFVNEPTEDLFKVNLYSNFVFDNYPIEDFGGDVTSECIKNIKEKLLKNRLVLNIVEEQLEKDSTKFIKRFTDLIDNYN